MPILFRDARFLDHRTGDHPESHGRLISIEAMLAESGLDQPFHSGTSRHATNEELQRVHSLRHIEAVEQFASQGGGRIEVDTIVCPESPGVARLAAGTSCAAVDQILNGFHQQAIVLCRPPGHHALADAPMGFCLYNNAAVAAAHARATYGLERVLIIDWDVHHGNGTQDIFFDDGQITFFSAHRYPFYPGTGASDETGIGRGLGATRNLPLPYGIRREEYRRRFASALEEAAAFSKPELVIVSAGFDAHAADPVGSLGLESEDFAHLTRLVLDVAKTHSEGRLVSLLEGGYDPPMLAESVQAHLEAIIEASRDGE